MSLGDWIGYEAFGPLWWLHKSGQRKRALAAQKAEAERTAAKIAALEARIAELERGSE